MNCSIYGAFFHERPSEKLVKGVCSPCLFLKHFEGGFAGASELSEPESFLWAVGSLASEPSEVGVLSPRLSSGC